LTVPVVTTLFSYFVASLFSDGSGAILALLGILIGASLVVSGNHASRLFPDRRLPRVLSGIGGVLLLVPFVLKDADRYHQRLLDSLGSESFDGRHWGAAIFAWILLIFGTLGLISPFSRPPSKARTRAISLISYLLLVAFPFALGQSWWERDGGYAVLSVAKGDPLYAAWMSCWEERDLMIKFWLLGSGHTILLSTAVGAWIEEVLSTVDQPPPTHVPPKWMGILVGMILLLGLSLFMLPGVERAHLHSRQHNAYVCMGTLSVAEYDFREHDRDGNGAQDFWTGDVAGLFKFGKIPRELAEADAAPLHPLVPAPVPYKGYLFKALLSDASETPPVSYRQETDIVSGKVHNLTKFGFVAFPADPLGDAQTIFIVNENNTIFPRRNTANPPTDWPTDDDLKRYYSKE